jgi:four helix bundle protein
MEVIRRHQDLLVYQKAFEAAMEIYTISKQFPRIESYSLTDQIRRSSRSVCANLSEAYRKKKYEKLLISKISDCEGESAETQVWLDFSKACGYLSDPDYLRLMKIYDEILGMLVMIRINPSKWSK